MATEAAAWWATRKSMVKFVRRQLDRMAVNGLLDVRQHKKATKGSDKRYVLTGTGRTHLQRQLLDLVDSAPGPRPPRTRAGGEQGPRGPAGQRVTVHGGAAPPSGQGAGREGASTAPAGVGTASVEQRLAVLETQLARLMDMVLQQQQQQ